jgi:transcriptional regulator with XRE-family HTH domain
MAGSRASRTVREWLASGTEGDPHTQEILAERLGSVVGRVVNQSTISNIKTGKSVPRIDLIEAFRSVLGIEPAWWLPDMSSACECSDSDNDAA